MISISQLVNIIKESIEEMEVFHGSGSKFDRFNHKKFNKTGCKSNTFGYGSYFTDDEAIANSYADSFKKELIFKDGSPITPENIAKFLNMSDKDSKLMYIYVVKLNNYDIDKRIIRTKKIIDDYESDDSLSHEKINKLETLKYKLLKLEELKNMTVNKKESYLYHVDIPEENGTNYIVWDKPVNNIIMKNVISGFNRLPKKYQQMICDNKSREMEMLKDSAPDGEGLYEMLTDILGSDKAASLFLSNCCGVQGLKYLTGTIMDKPEDAKENGYNYVLFGMDTNKIISRENR